MSVTTQYDPAPGPPSPWTGSQYRIQHRWQLELVGSLHAAAADLRALGAELTAAHRAGWQLVEPMRGGHLLAIRPSRRERARRAPGASLPVGEVSAPTRRWRLRVVDDQTGLRGEEAFDARAAVRTPVLAWTGGRLEQASGPGLAADALAELLRQVAPTGLPSRLWGVAPARVGPSLDLVADGSGLRLHAVQNGALIRTHEILTFQHATDGAVTLLHAAAAYERLARAADAMAAVGGRLVGADDGFLHIGYPRS